MRPLIATAAAALLLGQILNLASHGPGRAGTTVETSPVSRTMELLVFEHPDCSYCPVFRGRIAEQYKRSAHAAEAPIRFMDVTSTDADRIALKAPISMVPTAVVMKDGREVDRVAGLWSPDHFFKMISFIIRSAD